MIINIQGINIKVLIIKKNIKNMYFRIDENLNLLITVNKWISEKEIKRVIKEKEVTIYKMYQHKLKELDNNAYFIYLGDKYNVMYDDSIKKIDFHGDNVYTKDDKMLDKFYSKKCNEVFTKRVADIKNSFHNLPDFNLKFRKMKTRWGVCNVKDKTITLNTELLKKEISLIDYVIIHEICHFYHPNHSKEFWTLVGGYYPYYKKARKMLKEI